MPKTVSAEAQIRARNQLTIPDPIVRAAGIEQGEMFVVELESDDMDTLRLRRIRTSYSGALRGLWGRDVQADLDAQRDEWT